MRERETQHVVFLGGLCVFCREKIGMYDEKCGKFCFTACLKAVVQSNNQST